MKQDIKLIGLDIDGTILESFSTMRPRVKQAIEKALAAGIVVLPATGRQLQGIPKDFLEIPGIRYAVTGNGALVYELPDTVLHADCFAKTKALEMLDYLSQFDGMVGLYMGGKGYNQMVTPELEKALPTPVLEYLTTTRQYVPDLASVIEQSDFPVEKFTIFFANQERRLQAWQQLNTHNDSTTTSSVELNLEINTRTANKGVGLLKLGEKLGLRQDQIMAVGDGVNDIQMLRAVGYGVAMGNASPEVKQAADAVTADCSQDGVALAIEAVLKGCPL